MFLIPASNSEVKGEGLFLTSQGESKGTHHMVCITQKPLQDNFVLLER